MESTDATNGIDHTQHDALGYFCRVPASKMNMNLFNESDNSRGRRLSSPANESLWQSMYIAALDRYFGIRGLISPVTDTLNALDYDFYHPASERLIKVFRSVKEDAISPYQSPYNEEPPLYIIDAEAVGIGCICEFPHNEDALAARARLGAYVYLNDKIWEWDDDNSELAHLTPIERVLCIDKLFDMDLE